MSSKLGPLKIIQQTNKINTGTVIFFHGSGDTGPSVLEWVRFLVGDFSFPHLKFLFPTAPLRQYTPLNGEMSHVWFDRYDITPEVPEHKETLASIDLEIKDLIDAELKNGISLNNIIVGISNHKFYLMQLSLLSIVGGFSMGGALALHTAYRNIPGLAGTFALSSFLNTNSSVYNALKEAPEGINTPFIMFHGDHDTLVPHEWGKTTYNNLRKYGLKGDYHIVQNCFHELKKKEINQLFEWISKVLPNNNDM